MMAADLVTAPPTPAEHDHAVDSVPALGEGGGRMLRMSLVFSVTGIALFLVLALSGIAMRMNQAGWIHLEPTWFYRLMTIHGAGMFVAVLMSMMGIYYYALSAVVMPSRASMAWSYALVLAGAVTAIVAVIIGGFAGAWTFLFPLPFVSLGGWATWSAITFLVALVLIGLGWGVFFLEMLDRVVTRFGGLPRAMGLTYLFGRDQTPPPASVIGSCVVALVGLMAGTVGMTVLVAELVFGADRSTTIGTLWAKNTTYSFGHTIMNLLIYMAAVGLYTVVPRYVGRPWKATRPFVAAWLLSLVAVSTAYAHHLYMDFAQPYWAGVVGQIASSAAAIPVAVITVYTGLLLSWGSRYRWTLSSSFIYLGFAGWLIGGIAAVADSFIAVNFRFHNTLWVPAHFHSYLLMGVMLWAFAFLAHMLERAAERTSPTWMTKLTVILMVAGGYVLTGAWYISGAKGVPRRWAIQPDGAHVMSVVGTIGALTLLVGALLCCVQLIGLGRSAMRLRRARRVAPATADHRSLDAPDAVEIDPEAGHVNAFEGILHGRRGLVLAIIAWLIAMSPPLQEWSRTSVWAHHVVHAVQFGSGGVLGLWLGSLTMFNAALMRVPRSAAALWVMVMQATMMALMAPRIYEATENANLLHAAFHLTMVAIGIACGIVAVRFSRFTAWFAVALGVFAALLWAVGVS